MDQRRKSLVVERVQTMNPFAKRPSFDRRAVFTYRALTIFTWLLLVVSGILHTFFTLRGLPTIWAQNAAHPTSFALNPVITGIYWAALSLSQLGYIYFLFANNAEFVNAAANVGSHYILSNVLLVAFIQLWIRAEFWWAELVLLVNLYNLTSLYFRHTHVPRFVQIPVVAGPLAWAYMAIFWNGAAMVDKRTLLVRVVANVFVWSILLYGIFFLVAFKDTVMGFALTFLSTSLAVEQFLIKKAALQWIFAFVIMAVLFLITLIMALLGLFGKELTFVSENRETEPLLSGEE